MEILLFVVQSRDQQPDVATGRKDEEDDRKCKKEYGAACSLGGVSREETYSWVILISFLMQRKHGNCKIVFLRHRRRKLPSLFMFSYRNIILKIDGKSVL